MRPDDRLSAASKTTVRTRLVAGLLAIVGVMGAAAVVTIWLQEAMSVAFALASRMDTVQALLLECRRQEKNFFLRHDAESMVVFETTLEELMGEVGRLESDGSAVPLRSRLRRLSHGLERYRVAFREEATACVGSAVNHEHVHDLPEGPTVRAARVCHALVGEISARVVTRFERARAAAHTFGVLSIMAGALLSLLIAWRLTRVIVAPLERLRTVAEKVGSGDIQDMDVALRDLDLGDFASRESHQLAVALRRMVGSLRLLVPTERGLMDHTHMAIVLLVCRAVGPAAWSVVERARGRAGLASFSEVDACTLDRFLAGLEEELAPLLGEEATRLLVQTITDLQGWGSTGG